MQAYRTAAITANCNTCAELGIRVLREGGSVADAAIATLLCGGVHNPERMGIGGGFVLTLYQKKTRRVQVLVARECAPAAADENMFQNDRKSSIFGGKAVAVPGSLMGYWELHRKFGKLPWKRLVEPSVQMCHDGVDVQPFTRIGLKQLEENIKKSTTLRNVMVDPFSGNVKTEKQRISRPRLHKTLSLVSNENPSVLYNGILTEDFVRDIRNEEGIMTASDLKNYSVRWIEPIQIRLPGNLTAYAPPIPASGAVLLCILNILSQNFNPKEDPPEKLWFRLIETWKFAYGFRSQLGDDDNNRSIVAQMISNETAMRISKKIDENNNKTRTDCRHYGGDFLLPSDKGTAHFNFIASNGDAIAVTESINTLFGAMFCSLSTGIILNNTMDDFSVKGENFFNLPPSRANCIAPNKMPVTSMVPTIITDDQTGDVRLVIGAAGGTKIISAVSLVIFRHLFLHRNINDAVELPRLHHQLMPMQIKYEKDFSSDILHKLWLCGHEIKQMTRFSIVSAISRENGALYAKGDTRRHCATSGF